MFNDVYLHLQLYYYDGLLTFGIENNDGIGILLLLYSLIVLGYPVLQPGTTQTGIFNNF